jgi:hypothetical protein
MVDCLEYIFEEAVFVVLVLGTILFGLTSMRGFVLIEVRTAPNTLPLMARIVGSRAQMAVSDKLRLFFSPLISNPLKLNTSAGSRCVR